MPSVTEQTAARNLLAIIFRDGGHYREEHGIQSYADAEAEVLKLRDGPPADNLIYAMELVMTYCKDLMSGNYKPEPGENPLQKIYDITNIGKMGTIKRPEESPVGDET